MNDFPEEADRLAAELRRLPTPMAPPALVERVRRLAHLELAGRADEKLNRLVLVFLLVFSWTVALVGFLMVRVVASGTAGFVGLAALTTFQGSTLTWTLSYFGAAWISGVALFVLLGLHYRKQRRIA